MSKISLGIIETTQDAVKEKHKSVTPDLMGFADVKIYLSFQDQKGKQKANFEELGEELKDTAEKDVHNEAATIFLEWKTSSEQKEIDSSILQIEKLLLEKKMFKKCSDQLRMIFDYLAKKSSVSKEDRIKIELLNAISNAWEKNYDQLMEFYFKYIDNGEFKNLSKISKEYITEFEPTLETFCLLQQIHGRPTNEYERDRLRVILGELESFYISDPDNIPALRGISFICFQLLKYVPGIEYHMELRQKILPYLEGNQRLQELYTKATIRMAITYQEYEKDDLAFNLLIESLDQKFCRLQIVNTLVSLKDDYYYVQNVNDNVKNAIQMAENNKIPEARKRFNDCFRDMEKFQKDIFSFHFGFLIEIMADMRKHKMFTEEEISKICDAGLENIERWENLLKTKKIASDEIQSHYTGLLKQKENLKYLKENEDISMDNAKEQIGN